MSFPKSAGEPGSTVAPKSAKRALILGSAISLLSFSTTSGGVLGNADAIPRCRLVARHELAHGREVRQRARARRSGDCERAQLARPNVLDGCQPCRKAPRGDRSELAPEAPTGADENDDQAEGQVDADDLADAVEAGAGAWPVLSVDGPFVYQPRSVE